MIEFLNFQVFSSDQPPSQKAKNDVKEACAISMYGHVISCVANFTAHVKSCAGESPHCMHDRLFITNTDHLFESQTVVYMT